MNAVLRFEHQAIELVVGPEAALLHSILEPIQVA